MSGLGLLPRKIGTNIPFCKGVEEASDLRKAASRRAPRGPGYPPARVSSMVDIERAAHGDDPIHGLPMPSAATDHDKATALAVRKQAIKQGHRATSLLCDKAQCGPPGP